MEEVRTCKFCGSKVVEKYIRVGANSEPIWHCLTCDENFFEDEVIHEDTYVAKSIYNMNLEELRDVIIKYDAYVAKCNEQDKPPMCAKVFLERHYKI